MMQSQLIEAHNIDTEMQQWKTKEKPSSQGKIAGALCRRWIPHNQLAELCDQVVLPGHYRPTYLTLPMTN